MFFKGFDRRLFVDPTEGYAYYRVSGAGAPPNISRIDPRKVIPSFSQDPVSSCLAGDNGRLLISEYRDGFHQLVAMEPSGATRILYTFPIENLYPAMSL